MSRLLFWGAGAIGGSVAAYLARAGHDVTVVDASEAHVASVRQHGLRLVGPIASFTQPLRIFTPAELEGRWQHVVLAVKAQWTEAACRQLLPHLEDDGAVVSLQNGLCELLIAKQVGAGRTIGAIVGFAGDVLGPGEIRVGGGEKFSIGELDGSVSERVRRLAAAFADFVPPAAISTNIWGDLWGKMAFMGLLYGSTLGASTMATVWADPALFPVWRALVSEIVETAVAQGIDPVEVHGLMPENFRIGMPVEAARRNMAAMVDFVGTTAKTHSGMWRDIAIHRRKTEADLQIPPIIEAGAAHGVSTPALSAFFELYRKVENHEIAQSDALIAQLLPAAMRSPVNLQAAPVG